MTSLPYLAAERIFNFFFLADNTDAKDSNQTKPDTNANSAELTPNAGTDTCVMIKLVLDFNSKFSHFGTSDSRNKPMIVVVHLCINSKCCGTLYDRSELIVRFGFHNGTKKID